MPICPCCAAHPQRLSRQYPDVGNHRGMLLALWAPWVGSDSRMATPPSTPEHHGATACFQRQLMIERYIAFGAGSCAISSAISMQWKRC